MEVAFVGTRRHECTDAGPDALALAGRGAAADAVLFGVPLDATETYRPGCAEGPRAIRLASESIETYSPFSDRDLEDYRVIDVGDLPITGNVEADLATIESFVREVEVPTVMLGGEHTVSLAAVRAYAAKYPGLMVVALDAHTDLRDEYEGQRVNHATWLRRALEVVPPERVLLLGVRAGTREEFRAGLLEMREDVEISDVNMGALAKAPAVYLTIDIDVLDAPYVPGCGNPEPGGLHYKELEELVIWLGLSTNLVGFDLVEVAPRYDASGMTAITASRVVRETLLAMMR